MLVTWISLALAVLSKGIVAPVLTGGTLVLYMLISRDASPLRRMQFVLGVPLFLAITVPWFLLVQARNPEFAQFFFIHEHFQRFVNNGTEHIEAWWYFLVIVLIALLPVIWNARHWRPAPANVAGEFRVERFLFIWCAVVLVFFSMSSSKLASYVMPLMPAAAVLLARVTAAQATAYRRALITLLIVLVIAAIGIVASGRKAGSLPTTALVWAGAVPVLCAALLLYQWKGGSSELGRRWITLGAAGIASIQCLSLCYAAVYPGRSTHKVVDEIAGLITPDTHLYGVAQYRQSLGWYLRREIELYNYHGELAFGMQHAGPGAWPRDRGQFLVLWRQESKAIAFIDKDIYPDLHANGMPGRIVASDARSIVVSR
jgi:4-amino-4-deoxy-L-arabinose transferase-like glycosyltransferase